MRIYKVCKKNAIMAKKTKPIKRHKVGFESEFLLLENNGAVSSRADELMARLQKKQPGYPVQKEYTHNVIEITSHVKRKVLHATGGWLRTVQMAIEEAKAADLKLLPHAYFGKYAPSPRSDPYYRMKEEVIGPTKMVFAESRSQAFHFHYCLPYGTFSRGEKQLKRLVYSKNKDLLISMHNAIIAADSALISFMQSSPFVEGRHYAMDCRSLIYGTMRVKKGERIIEGLYRKHKIFGKLPRYTHAIAGLGLRVQKQYEEFKEIVEEEHPHYMHVVEQMHPTKFYWGALRISRYGTFEYRGMDMNLPTYIIGSSLLLKYMLKRIRNERLVTTPSDIGISEPFKVEGKKLYVPPYTYLQEVLRPKAVIRGTGSLEVRKYMKKFAEFVMPKIPKRRDLGLERIKQILQTGKTRSDILLKQAHRLGWGRDSELSHEIACELALKSSRELEDEVARLLESELIIDAEK